MDAGILSLIGMVIAIAGMIWLAWKGLSIYVTTLVCSAIVIIFGKMNFWTTINTYFAAGVAGFAKSYFLLFALSAVYAKLMGDSGAASSIAGAILKVAKKTNKGEIVAMLLVMSVSFIFTYCGISLFVVTFLMTTIGSKIYEDLDIPWHLYCAGSWASGTVTMSMLPGSPQTVNLVPMKYFGTTAAAAPTIGIICSVITIVLEIAYINFALKSAKKKGEGFLPTGTVIKARNADKSTELEIKMPLWYALIPSVALLIVLNVPVFGNEPNFAMVVAIVLSLILFRKELPVSKWNSTITAGFEQGIGVVCSVAVVVGFGTVVKAAPGYSLVCSVLDNLPGSPLLQIVIVANVCAGFAGSASGGLTIALDSFAEKFMNMGVNPQVLHRLSAISAGGLDSLPHNPSVMIALKVQGLTHKQAYKHYFIECTAIPIVIAFVAVALAEMGLC